MPFDGVESPTFLALAKLSAVRELIADQRRWCKGSLINAAGQMCILGALQRANAEDELKPLILVAAREITGRTFRSIERFNDHHKTTHATVLEVLDRTRDGLIGGRYRVGKPTTFGRWRSLCRRFVAETLLKA